MSEDIGSVIKTHVPDKGISEITLRNLNRYDDADFLARTGMPNDPTHSPRNHNEKVSNRFEGLKLMIACQQHLISGNNMATVEKNCINAWKRKFKEEEDRKKNLFEVEINDVNELKAILTFLDECEQKIEVARKTSSLEDDFVWDKEHHDGEMAKELTPNFFAMFKELIESYTAIYGILLKNKIVTLGEGDDADKTEKEKEQELINRVLNA